MPCWHRHCNTPSPRRIGSAEPLHFWHVQLLRACSSRNVQLAQRVPVQQLDPSTAQPTEICFQTDATWPTTATLVGTSALERTMARGPARRALGNQVLREGPSSVGVPLTSTRVTTVQNSPQFRCSAWVAAISDAPCAGRAADVLGVSCLVTLAWCRTSSTRRVRHFGACM